MKNITLNELMSKKQQAAKSRMKAKEATSGKKGDKPRSLEEIKVLTRMTVNRVRKAIEEGIWDISHLKEERRIIFRGGDIKGNKEN